MNHLSDRTVEEFRRLLGYKKSVGFSQRENDVANTAASNNLLPVSALPTDVDWRQKGAVTPVKDQVRFCRCSPSCVPAV